MEHNKKERSSFSGGIGFVLAAAGSAVGLCGVFLTLPRSTAEVFLFWYISFWH